MADSDEETRRLRQKSDRTGRDMSVRIEVVSIFVVVVLAILNAVRILI